MTTANLTKPWSDQRCHMCSNTIIRHTKAYFVQHKRRDRNTQTAGRWVCKTCYQQEHAN